MSFLDKVKASAEQAVTKAQQGVDQAQAKVSEVQATRTKDALYRDLGAAYYAQMRTGGSAEAVTTALAALDTLDSQPAAGATDPEAPAGP